VKLRDHSDNEDMKAKKDEAKKKEQTKEGENGA
jgi:hypothetical protein